METLPQRADFFFFLIRFVSVSVSIWTSLCHSFFCFCFCFCFCFPVSISAPVHTFVRSKLRRGLLSVTCHTSSCGPVTVLFIYFLLTTAETRNRTCSGNIVEKIPSGMIQCKKSLNGFRVQLKVASVPCTLPRGYKAAWGGFQISSGKTSSSGTD